MDPTHEIKVRLPIEELVGQYCQLQKKGRNFVCLCPFHSDTHPSLLVSPDKGIAYCFACQTGGDVFSFYQAIEGVDFPQALRDLAEKVGVELPDRSQESVIKKDEKDRLRECLACALTFFREQLAKSKVAQAYITSRLVPEDQVMQFELGFAPDSFSVTYEHLLKKGFSRSEIVKAGLGIQKELKEDRIYDRFRNRLIFPIHSHQGKLVGFGGRTLGEDDAKYINSSEGPLYHKASVLYGMHLAKDAMRSSKAVVMVEGYFDVLACHRTGVQNVVAVSGTSLTEDHVKILQRNVEKVVLCLDQDRAGRAAAERAYLLCTKEGIHVHAVTLPEKDPDETANKEPELLKSILTESSQPYLDLVLSESAKEEDAHSVDGKRRMMKRILPLIDVIATSVEQTHYIRQLAVLLGTTETALLDDLKKIEKQMMSPIAPMQEQAKPENSADQISPLDLSLVLFVLYPTLRHLIDRLIVPQKGFAQALYEALKTSNEQKTQLELKEPYQERLSILQLYCEDHSLTGWSESLAQRELLKNCMRANRDCLQRKQREITQKMLTAQAQGNAEEQRMLSAQYQEVLKLTKIAIQ